MTQADLIGIGFLIVVTQIFLSIVYYAIKDWSKCKDREKEAISYGYATYDKDLKFKWNNQITNHLT